MPIYRGDGGSPGSTTETTLNAVTEKANEAAVSATNAANSADSAATSATTATTKATAAAASATTASAAVTTTTANANSASTSASNAATSASNALSSANSAASSATSATASATSATSSASSATSSASSASTSATNAANSATAAATSASNAATSATNAASSESSVAANATAAAASETAAAASESAAATSETNAATSASTASSAATSATASATSATASATAASSSETNAATSETNAANSATAAATSASNASTSATNAATSETNASSSESNAAASAASAAASFDSFDDRYLGVKGTDPSTDNDGDALATGALFFSTETNTMKVYNGSSWEAAYLPASGYLALTGGTLTGGLTLSGDPSTALGAATKQYVDTIAAAGIHYHDPVRVEKEGNLSATYDNGSSGVGATLTNNSTQEALVIDGVSLALNDRVLIYEQTNAYENGIYTVTTVGDGSTNWVLTRATDADSYGPSDSGSLGEGDAFFVLEGSLGAGELYVMTTSGSITFGTTAITFSQIATSQIYTAGAGITINGTEISVSSSGTLDSVTDAGATTTNSITVGGLHVNTTGAAEMPAGTTAQRPTGVAGMARFNTDTSYFEFYTGSSWYPATPPEPEIAYSSGNIVAGASTTFTVSGTNLGSNPGSFNFIQASDSIDVDVVSAAPSNGYVSVTIPSSVYDNLTAGNVLTIVFTSEYGVESNSITATAGSLPSGGTITTSGNYRIHTYTSSGTFDTTYLDLTGVEYLVIAGGGGSGLYASGRDGGGAGAGGYRCSVSGESSGGGSSAENPIDIPAGSYTVTVGAGAATRNQGGASSIGSLVTTVGGGPGGYDTYGGYGGSGGGGSNGRYLTYYPGGSGVAGEGFAGGNGGNPQSTDGPGGGGGGAGAVGSDKGAGGHGGVGVSSSITGTAVTRAGGGGGSSRYSGKSPGTGGSGGGGNGGWSYYGQFCGNGATNTGGGAGARGPSNDSNGYGGSGIVVIRYDVTSAW